MKEGGDEGSCTGIGGVEGEGDSRRVVGEKKGVGEGGGEGGKGEGGDQERTQRDVVVVDKSTTPRTVLSDCVEVP